MNFLRSLLYLLAVALYTPPFVIALLLLFWLPTRKFRQVSMIWVHIAMWLIRHVLRIDHRVLGAENIPATPCVVLSKHQSAWETIVLQHVFAMASYVYKKELHWLPFFGWGLAALPFVGIDRNAGKDALAQVATRGKQRLAEGYPVVIFPEGTRVAPGSKKRYKIGGAYLAVQAGVPAVPVALNSGEFWRRNAFVKCPGTVTMSIGPAIDPAGLSAEDINARVETWIETEMRRISPHLYGNETEAPAPARSAA
ncbi:MAG: 1-acyl-sn-glycerol-3-phosphate acyltransferase [Rhodocyclales bacterium]|jgi:1-acyl-sn-glycerol-3-phosphate acyltransferase|nr:1-acyl-sn-glycerol-3-phosphate acyltransferase [Rhodocyclales bacterium]